LQWMGDSNCKFLLYFLLIRSFLFLSGRSRQNVERIFSASSEK
jgi:hypothetical protein